MQVKSIFVKVVYTRQKQCGILKGMVVCIMSSCTLVFIIGIWIIKIIEILGDMKNCYCIFYLINCTKNIQIEEFHNQSIKYDNIVVAKSICSFDFQRSVLFRYSYWFVLSMNTACDLIDVEWISFNCTRILSKMIVTISTQHRYQTNRLIMPITTVAISYFSFSYCTHGTIISMG